jgi:hypothetical protein
MYHHTPRRRTQVRARVPYGRWTTADGREVLFDRRYQPMFERRPGQCARPVAPQWVRWTLQENFYDDGSPPWPDAVKKINAVLAAWGLPPIPMPRRRKK